MPYQHLPSVSEIYESFDAAYPHKVKIYDTFFLEPWGVFIIYGPVSHFPADWPRSSHIDIFLANYTPSSLGKPCAPYLPANSSSKTFSQWARYWFTEAQKRWTRVISFYKKPW